MSVSENDGQTVRAAFLLRERLYLVKDRSLHVTEDDGVNEPASWTINEVSQRRGHAVGRGRGSGRGLGRDRRARRDVHFRWRRADQNFAGNSAAVGHDQLGRRANAVGARGHAQQAHPVRRADGHGDFAESDFGAGLSQPVERQRNRIAWLDPVFDAVGKIVRGGPLAQVVPVEYHGEFLRARRTLRRHRAGFSGQRTRSAARATEKSISFPTRNFPTMARPSIPTTRHTFF